MHESPQHTTEPVPELGWIYAYLAPPRGDWKVRSKYVNAFCCEKAMGGRMIRAEVTGREDEDGQFVMICLSCKTRYPTIGEVADARDNILGSDRSGVLLVPPGVLPQNVIVFLHRCASEMRSLPGGLIVAGGKILRPS